MTIHISAKNRRKNDQQNIEMDAYRNSKCKEGFSEIL